MSRFLSSVICAVLLSSYGLAAPAPQGSVPPSVASSAAPAVSSILSAAAAIPTVVFATDNPNRLAWNPNNETAVVEPIRGALGATILGPQNEAIQLQNPDLLAPPTTDHGSVYVPFHLDIGYVLNRLCFSGATRNGR